MKTLIALITLSLLLATASQAAICSNAINSFQRRIDSNDQRCKNSAAVDRLKVRLSEATSEKLKVSIQRQIRTATSRQQVYCAAVDKIKADQAKVAGFCENLVSFNTDYCDLGYTIRIVGTNATARCKRGRLWSSEKGKCYFIEEYYFTNSKTYLNAKANPRGEILYSGQPASNYFQLNTGFLVNNIKTSDACAVR
jgi:hypothetical protein